MQEQFLSLVSGDLRIPLEGGGGEPFLLLFDFLVIFLGLSLSSVSS